MKPYVFRLALPGGEVECFSWGPSPGETPTILFLHEGLGSAGLWRDFPAKVSKATGFGAVAVSRLGYGTSDPCELPRPLDYMEREAKLVMPLLVEGLKLKDFALFGHSDGGSIALLYGAGEHLPGLKGIVTEAAHVFCEELTLASIRAAREKFVSGDLAKKLARHHGANTECAFWGWNRLWLDPGFATWDFTAKLPAIDVPLLSFQGELDEYGTPLQIEALKRRAGARTAFIPGAGHSPHREKEAETLSLTVDFLLEILGGRVL